MLTNQMEAPLEKILWDNIPIVGHKILFPQFQLRPPSWAVAALTWAETEPRPSASEQPWAVAEQLTEELARPDSGPTGAYFWALGLGTLQLLTLFY
jgi:hypothetical protein